MTAWGWGDKGKKAHAFDGSDRALCGKAVKVEDAVGVPDKDKCAACRKAADVRAAVEARAAVDNAPKPVRIFDVRPPPGADVCASTVHAGQVVRATFPGVYVLPVVAGDTANLCGWCAWMVSVQVPWFVTEADDPPVCVRCSSALCVAAHTPCCDHPPPHGRPLCCHCYGETHHVVGVPCH